MGSRSSREVTAQWLGAAGWAFRAGGRALLIDPYVTRTGVWRVLFGRLQPDEALIHAVVPRADWIILSHAHYDHLADAPTIAARDGAAVYASGNGVQLLAGLGVPEAQLHQLTPGAQFTCGPFTITAYKAPHRRFVGRVPFVGNPPPTIQAPLRAGDYRFDWLCSPLIEVDGQRILVSGGVDGEPRVQADVWLVGADGAPKWYAEMLPIVQPRVVMPTHWDDMFRPLLSSMRPLPDRMRPWRCIDLDAFQAAVARCAPKVRVVVPEPFDEIALGWPPCC